MIASAGALVFPTDKSGTGAFEDDDRAPLNGHVEGCYRRGAAFVWSDGRTAPVPSRASNRCAGCARAAAFEAMTMLRQDAETNSAPGHVVTLTSRRPDVSAAEYRDACAVFWRAFRRRWGRVEFCGFIEWTTGRGPRSGGHRRLHSHWLVKSLALGEDEHVTRATGAAPCTCGDAGVCVECWTAAEWRKLTGAWIVQARKLETVGGVVGYLALHHEKMEQRPPDGWTGRRLRPSQGYFAEDGRTRREKARAWLRERRWTRSGLDEGGKVAASLAGAPRLVWARTERVKASEATLHAGPGRPTTLADVRWWESLLDHPDAPLNWDRLSRLVADEDQRRFAYAYRLRRERQERDIRARESVKLRRERLKSAADPTTAGGLAPAAAGR